MMARCTTAGLALLLAIAAAGCAEAGEDVGEDVGEDAGLMQDTEAVQPTDLAATGAEDGALVDPNEASRDELMALPGLDSTAVATIMEQRPFDGMLALNSVLSEGMDSAGVDQLYREMFIPLDLNQASREEMLLIPGAGPRMVGEFMEYRPYEGGMAEFRQEIGKYVDEEEVARLERYFVIR